VVLPGCGTGEPLRASTIQLGKSLNSDNSVGTHTTRFMPEDTIYVSVLTTGPGSGTLVARWFYGAGVASEMKKDVAYNREAFTEFHLQNSAGFQPGQYKVEVLLDGTSIGEREFRVGN
jgi:hypothetical protein